MSDGSLAQPMQARLSATFEGAGLVSITARMSSATAVWPSPSAQCRAESPWSSSSSVSALARSRAFTHASCPWPAACIRVVRPSMSCRSRLAEFCMRRSRMERWPLYAACMSAVMPRLVGKLTLAPRFSSTLANSR
eukprot:scaffold47396_cov67-Phaeocystis_antarctica.AAC.4